MTTHWLTVFVVGALCALAFRFDWRLRLPLILASAAIFAIYTMPSSLGWDDGGLLFLLGLLPGLIVVTISIAAGAVARRAGTPPIDWVLKVGGVASFVAVLTLLGGELP